MKMVSHNTWKRTNVQLVSLACGLALATVAIVGGNEILRDNDATVIISPAAVQPQFATASDADYASLGLAYLRTAEVTPESLVGPAEALGIGQPGEGTKSVAATLIDPTDFGSLGIAYQLTQQGKTTESVQAAEAYAAFRPQTSVVPQPQFGTAADAVYAAESLGTQQAPVSPGDALGIGQPGEGTQSVAAPQFGTAADAVYVMEAEVQLP